MNIQVSRSTIRGLMLCVAATLLATGCNKKTDNNLNFTNAINTYYSAHPVCLWSEPIKFPVQADTSDTSKTSGYDALVDQGLLVRTTAEKKKMILGSKQVNNYDLSDKGRSAWTADVQQPGFGNFCYGHRKVSSIDSSTPTTQQRGSDDTGQLTTMSSPTCLPGRLRRRHRMLIRRFTPISQARRPDRRR